MAEYDSRRVEYRKYLERAGVIDALRKSMLILYQEGENKPENAVNFVRKFMCETCPDDDEYDMMKTELEECQRTIRDMEEEVRTLREKIGLSPEEIAKLLDDGYRNLNEDTVNTNSLLRKHLTPEILNLYRYVKTSGNANLFDCIQTGLKHHDAPVGVYAADPKSYDVYSKLFEPIVKDYHGQSEQKENKWGELDSIKNLDPENKYILSTEIRIARNLEGFPFFPKLTQQQYEDIAKKVEAATRVLDGEQTGIYFPLTDIDAQTQKQLVARQTLFKTGDEQLTTAGAYRFWPTGRGIYYNPDETFIIWVNELDHLRIISKAPFGNMGDVYNRLITGVQELEKNLTFLRHPTYGYLSASPTNLGTALDCTMQIQLPLLAEDPERVKGMANDLFLQIRGTGDDPSAFVDGIMVVSNSRHLGLTELNLLNSMQDGINALITAEEVLAGGEGAGEGEGEGGEEPAEDNAQ